MPLLWLCPQLITWKPERSPPYSPCPLLRYLGELAKTLISFKCFPRIIGLPRWLSGKESSYQCRRCRRLGFDPWVRKIPWRREWQPTPIFLPGESMDRGAWRAIVYEVAKSLIQLSTHTHGSSVQFSSVTQSCPTLRPHESQHARPPCPSPTPRVYWDSHPSSQWCHPDISSSVVPFSSCPQSLPPSLPPGLQGFIQWVNSSHEVAKVLEFQL